MVPQRGWGPQLEGVGEVTGSRQGNGHDELRVLSSRGIRLAVGGVGVGGPLMLPPCHPTTTLLPPR